MFAEARSAVVSEFLGQTKWVNGRPITVIGVGNVLDRGGVMRLHVRLADGTDSVFAHNVLARALGVPLQKLRAHKGVATHLLRSTLVSGTAVGHAQCQCLGTLGAILIDSDGDVHALSNRHVLALRGKASLCDAVVDSDGFRVAHVSFVAPLDGLVDAALAHLESGNHVQVLRELGCFAPRIGEACWKLGIASGVSNGHIVSTDFALAIELESGLRPFVNQIAIRADRGGAFSVAGDSGSLIRRADGNAVGLLFAGDTGASQGERLTFANPIQTVMASIPWKVRVFA